MSQKKEKEKIDLENLNTANIPDEQIETIKSRGKMIRNIITFVGFHWEDLKLNFAVMKKKCDHWEQLRKLSNDPDRGGCKFCPAFTPEKLCIIKDVWVPQFKKETK